MFSLDSIHPYYHPLDHSPDQSDLFSAPPFSTDCCESTDSFFDNQREENYIDFPQTFLFQHTESQLPSEIITEPSQTISTKFDTSQTTFHSVPDSMSQANPIIPQMPSQVSSEVGSVWSSGQSFDFPKPEKRTDPAPDHHTPDIQPSPRTTRPKKSGTKYPSTSLIVDKLMIDGPDQLPLALVPFQTGNKAKLTFQINKNYSKLTFQDLKLPGAPLTFSQALMSSRRAAEFRSHFPLPGSSYIRKTQSGPVPVPSQSEMVSRERLPVLFDIGMYGPFTCFPTCHEVPEEDDTHLWLRFVTWAPLKTNFCTKTDRNPQNYNPVDFFTELLHFSRSPQPPAAHGADASREQTPLPQAPMQQPLIVLFRLRKGTSWDDVQKKLEPYRQTFLH